MTTTTAETTFAEATRVTARATGELIADLDARWTVAGNPNGGYLQAVMARAAETASEHQQVIAASSHFLRAPHTGHADLAVKLLRQGRSASQVRVQLRQDGETKVETTFTLGTLTAGAEPQWATTDLPLAALPFEDCPRFVPPQEVFPVAILQHLGLHLEPESLAFTAGKPRGLGELRGWLTLPEQADFDPNSLLLAADAFPPATFDLQMTGWVPTLELTTYVRALPAPGPVHVLLKANLIQDGRLDETCTIRDSAGQIVAQSHQLAAIRFS